MTSKESLLFPPYVARCTIDFDEQDARDASVLFNVALPARLDCAVRRRRLEFAAGRHCAREAIRCLAPERADEPVGVGPSREPIWPEGLVGAITHTHGIASAAVARAIDARGIGLDAEAWISDDVAREVAGSIARHQEIDAVTTCTGWPFSEALTLIFSAKETLFKCLFNEVKAYFGFLDAEIIAIDSQGEFAGRLMRELTPSLPAGHVFTGRFEIDRQHVWTASVRRN